MIAIHDSKLGFHPRWKKYCQQENISYKLVDCFADDLTAQIQDCSAVMWHHSHDHPQDVLIAGKIMKALEHTGMSVFPDFRTAWHFDDKIAQKYLLERVKAPMVSSHVFFDKSEALKWIDSTDFPVVIKLRSGAGSANVTLVNSRREAFKLIRKAFGKGFPSYNAMGGLNEAWRKWRLQKVGFLELVKRTARVIFPPAWSLSKGRERGYAYFQEFIPNNTSDTRIIVIGDKAFAIKRHVRENDFRASGSGETSYEREEFDERCVQIAFDISKKLHFQCMAYDFVFNSANNPLVVEISYGFNSEVYDPCTGYWDNNLRWNAGKINPQGWMVDLVISKGRKRG